MTIFDLVPAKAVELGITNDCLKKKFNDIFCFKILDTNYWMAAHYYVF